MDRRLIRHSRRQHGLFTLAQALAAGFTYPTIRRRLATGVWEQVEPKVYRVAGAPLGWRQRLLALVLTTGGVASGAAAAALYGLVPEGALEVSVAREGASLRHRRPEVRVVGVLTFTDIATVDGIPSTRPARTLVDLASRMPLGEFEDVLDLALVRRVVNRARLQLCAERLWTPRRPGCAAVLRLLEARHPQLERARNEWEALVLRLCRRFGLPDPVPNYRVFVGGRWREIDAAWPGEKVAVEFDGFVPHSSRRQFDDDRVRQNDLVDDGWRPFRLTKTALARDPGRAFEPVARAVKRGQL
ncbi:MAG: type IV toxin-antitoxin system AbiEi family antitoxin domain-containing protein [Actinobacteria bacterium]|nr:type IV toxin-antitoxin system AbiEi family antitoxin domain-containing protein [Actinomycetota bacterium]